jgi:hypothetical protein
MSPAVAPNAEQPASSRPAEILAVGVTVSAERCSTQFAPNAAAPPKYLSSQGLTGLFTVVTATRHSALPVHAGKYNPNIAG